MDELQAWRHKMETTNKLMETFREIEAKSKHYIDAAVKREKRRATVAAARNRKSKLTVEDRMNTLRRQATLQAFSRSNTHGSQLRQPARIITVEALTDRDTYPSRRADDEHDELGTIEEEDRDGSSRRGDEDTERGISLSVVPVERSTEKNVISVSDLAERRASTSMFARAPELSLSINAEYEEEASPASLQRRRAQSRKTFQAEDK